MAGTAENVKVGILICPATKALRGPAATGCWSQSCSCAHAAGRCTVLGAPSTNLSPPCNRTNNARISNERFIYTNSSLSPRRPDGRVGLRRWSKVPVRSRAGVQIPLRSGFFFWCFIGSIDFEDFSGVLNFHLNKTCFERHFSLFCFVLWVLKIFRGLKFSLEQNLF
jgi:hypothetical protein